MAPASLPDDLVRRLYRRARADRWAVPREAFRSALERSVEKALPGSTPREAERYLGALHLEDLALACACAEGHETAWEHFVREHRPVLYRAADAIDPTGGCRELADSLYGELFGLSDGGRERKSLFQYFHARSSLGTWLRAVLSQRHVDRIRSSRRFEPLEAGEDREGTVPAAAPEIQTDGGYLSLMRRIIPEAIGRLPPRDRLRLAYYYGQDLNLAQIGRALGEHEATVSRNLARVRKEVRVEVERILRERERMGSEEIAQCFASVVGDVGDLDVAELLGPDAGPDQSGSATDDQARKESGGGRSKNRREGANA
jgi:RNA polymerase sigma factor (sigma-70 family)